MMKKLMLNKGKALACLLLACLFAVQSCKKDLQTPSSSKTVIADAKLWYQQKMANARNFLKSDGGDSINVNIKPKWLNAITIRVDDQTEALIVPLQSDIPEKFAKKINPVLIIEKNADSYRSTVTNGLGSSIEDTNSDKNKVGSTLYEKAFGRHKDVIDIEGQKPAALDPHNPIRNQPNTGNTNNKIMGRGQDPIGLPDNCTEWYWITTTYDEDYNVIDVKSDYAFTSCFLDGGGGGGSDGSNFGIDPNCMNCQISDSNLEAFLEYARNAGMTVGSPFHTKVTFNGVDYLGTITQIYNSNGKLISAYFSPDSSSGTFQTGYSYNIGNKGPDGSSGLGNDRIDNPFFGSSYYDGGNPYGGGGVNITYLPSSTQVLVSALGLTYAEKSFLELHSNIANEIKAYLDVNGYTVENIDFAKWAVGYLVENSGVSFEDLKKGPQYKLDINIRTKYPKFSSIVDGLVFFLSANPKVVDALSNYSGFTKNEIFKLASKGSGPSIKLSNESWTQIANGLFNFKISSNTIFLSEDNVLNFENSFADAKRRNSLAFSLMATILHETVHYGRFQNGLADPDVTPDYGTKFEELGFGFNVEFRNNQPVYYKMYYLP